MSDSCPLQEPLVVADKVMKRKKPRQTGKKPYDVTKKTKKPRVASDSFATVKEPFDLCIKYFMNQIREKKLITPEYELGDDDILYKGLRKVIFINQDGTVVVNRNFYVGFLTKILKLCEKRMIQIDGKEEMKTPILDAMGYKLFLYDGSNKLEPTYVLKRKEKHFIRKEGDEKYELTPNDLQIIDYWDNVKNNEIDPLEAVVDLMKKPLKEQEEQIETEEEKEIEEEQIE